MRNFVFALVILLLAAPTWAAQEVECEVLVIPGPNYTVAIDYNIDDGNEFRAYGLKVEVNAGVVISDINVNDADYYIFPGSIDINDTTGDVDSNGSAVCDQTSNSFILEMGSLYADEDPDHNTAPPTSGRLCTFKVSKECQVTLIEDAARGGVVLKDTDKSYSGTPQGCTVPYDECYSKALGDWAQFDALGRPDGWCQGRHCHGDADGKNEGDPKVGYFYVWQNDLNVVLAGWKKDNAFLAANVSPAGIRLGNGDLDRKIEGDPKVGYFSVWQNDLNIVVNNWKSNPPADYCP